MGKVLIVKAGATCPGLIGQWGDFEDWIISGLALEPRDVRLADVPKGDELPDYAGLAGVVISGSHAMVTDGHGWSRRIEAWLPGVVARRIPLLGICYGHQLLARAFGGRVGDNPQGMEFGTVDVALNSAGRGDYLLGKMGDFLAFHVCHTQSVLELPPGAELLAASAADRHQAFRIGERAWGVQFHPEFNARIMAFYIREYSRELTRQGRRVDRLLSQTRDTPWGTKILRRFAALTQSLWHLRSEPEADPN